MLVPDNFSHKDEWAVKESAQKTNLYLHADRALGKRDFCICDDK